MTDNENTQRGERTQESGIARPHEGDSSWSRTQPLFIQPSQERMDKPHQIVDIKNNSDVEIGNRGFAVPTRHVIVDRFNQGHEIAPGETKRGIDMLAEDIAYFLRERRPGRVDHMNRMKPKHPIEIVGFDPDRVLPGQTAEGAGLHVEQGVRTHSEERQENTERTERTERERTPRERHARSRE